MRSELAILVIPPLEYNTLMANVARLDHPLKQHQLIWQFLVQLFESRQGTLWNYCLDNNKSTQLGSYLTVVGWRSIINSSIVGILEGSSLVLGHVSGYSQALFKLQNVKCNWSYSTVLSRDQHRGMFQTIPRPFLCKRYP